MTIAPIRPEHNLRAQNSTLLLMPGGLEQISPLAFSTSPTSILAITTALGAPMFVQVTLPPFIEQV